MLKYLAECSQVHPGSNHVMKLLDHFVVETTNGPYDGLALEIVGLNTFKELENSMYGKLSRERARRASVQAAMALAYMHQLKVGHGGSLTFSSLISVLSPQWLSPNVRAGRCPHRQCLLRSIGRK
jgi:hypothetical protein